MQMPQSAAQEPAEPFIPEVMPVTHDNPQARKPNFTKGEKTCLDSRPTPMQNFTHLAFSAAEKSVTTQKMTDKQTRSKLSIPPY